MTPNENLSILYLIGEASLLVQLVMALLALLSVLSWYWIFRKWFQIRAMRSNTGRFERSFWSGGDLNSLFQSASSSRHATVGMEHDHAAIIDGSRRAMRATQQREMDDLEAHLAFLATVGSVAPYIGLLGTVWGIMNAFRGLANVSTASLSLVAPGIAEALVATAIGLFAAIPAVVAYNRFTHDIDRIGIRFESFMEEFSNILQRHLR
jgi:biopolymer transport protein TolQ